jgi:hypothetical protein
MNRKLFTNTAALVLLTLGAVGSDTRSPMSPAATTNYFMGTTDSRFKAPNFRSRAYRGPRVSR